MGSSLERLQQDIPFTMTVRAFELRPAGSPPMPPEYLARIAASRPQLLRTAREQYGLTINPGPMGRPTRSAHVLAAAAMAHGFGDAMHRALLYAYWSEGRDISSEAVQRELALQIGMSDEQFEALRNDAAAQAAVEQDIAQARAFGLNSVPATVINDRYLISGAQPLEVLRQSLLQAQATREDDE